MSPRLVKILALSFALAAFPCNADLRAAAQASPPPDLIQHLDGTLEARQRIAPGDTVAVLSRGGKQPLQSAIVAGEVGVIVRVEGVPLLRLGGASARALRAEQERLHGVLNRVSDHVLRHENLTRESEGLARRKEAEVVRHRYTHVFTGVSARVRSAALESLRAIPGVTGVWIDQRAQASLSESVPLIQADRVWNEIGSTGNEVTVAIIDTGVDYTHPDLGDCFEPGCKVFFGWDFVNSDADPMDDHGHGTHVAGIVAADGVVMGVAPDARLMAIKVLDRYGYGDFSTVIAGIELAVDPDGDPGTRDGAQVMNISLGGPGDPDDPLAQAVDTAVAAGTVVAVAAGNAGPDFETLGSPGCARDALTVGATDETDVIAEFSSRGPAPVTFQIKPDVLAPGAGITSTVPAGTCTLCDPSRYLALNGTSMATPHVAGAAALILELQPAWTPGQVRSALMQRAASLGLSAFEQGSGRIDAYAAVTHGALADPPAFSAGRDNPGLPGFGASRTFTLANLGPSATDYALSLQGAFPAGLTVTLDRTHVPLDEGQSGTFTVEVSADNSILPNPASAPFAYEGTIVASSPTETLHFPFALLKAPLLRVDYDQTPWTVVLHDGSAFFRYHVYPGLTLSALVPPAEIDVVNLYDDGVTWVVYEGSAVTADTQVTIRRSDAAHPVRLVPIDEHGSPLTLTRSMTMSHFGPKTANFDTYVLPDFGGLAGSPTLFNLSPMTSAYTFEVSVLQEPGGSGTTYAFHGGVSQGVSGPLDFQNSPADFKHFTWRYTPEPGGTRVTPWTWFSTRPWGSWGIMAFAKCDTSQGMTAPFQREAYFVPIPYPEYGIGYLMQEVFGQPPMPPCDFAGHLYTTPYLVAGGAGRLDAYQRFMATPSWSLAGSTLTSGIGPYSWTGTFFNAPDRVFVDGGPYYDFMSQSKDVRDYPPLSFELSQAGAVIQTGTFNGSGGPGPLDLPVSPGRYRLRVPYASFHLGGVAARAEASAVFDTQSGDPNPPSIATFEIESGGACVDRIPPGGAVVRVGARDDVSVDHASLFYKSGGTYLPAPLALQPSGDYEATIPAPVGAPAVVPMAVVLEDAGGNSLTYSFCSASAATPEVCNGLDDDCNGAIPAGEIDGDGDLIPRCTPDCNDADPGIWGTPGEVTELILAHQGTTTTLEWTPPPMGGAAPSVVYDVLRSPSRSDFGPISLCLEAADGPNTSAADAEAPPPNEAFFYLVRARNACPAGQGTLGATSSGLERAGRACP